VFFKRKSMLKNGAAGWDGPAAEGYARGAMAKASSTAAFGSKIVPGDASAKT
jgi:hypothetical protein